jgi:hypothetical protein
VMSDQINQIALVDDNKHFIGKSFLPGFLARETRPLFPPGS